MVNELGDRELMLIVDVREMQIVCSFYEQIRRQPLCGGLTDKSARSHLRSARVLSRPRESRRGGRLSRAHLRPLRVIRALEQLRLVLTPPSAARVPQTTHKMSRVQHCLVRDKRGGYGARGESEGSGAETMRVLVIGS
eukprot:548559-Pleurochrysis_carterae.AAC.2